MNVDLVRALELKTSDPAPTGRSETGAQGFSELMDSMLGGGAGEEPAPRRPANDGKERPEPGGEARGTSAGRSQRSDRSEKANRSERRDRPDRSETRRAAGDVDEAEQADRAPEDDEPAVDAAHAAGRRGAARNEAADEEAEAPAAAVESQTTAVEVPAGPVAVPEWIALATGVLDAGSNAIDERSVPAEGEARAPVPGALLDAPGGAVVAGQTTGDGAETAPIVDPRAARLDARTASTIVAALEGARASEAQTADPAATAAPAVETVAPELVAETPADPAAPRPAVSRADGPRRDVEAPVLRAADTSVRPELAAAPAGGGDERFGEERPRDPQVLLAPAAPSPRAESSSTAPAPADAAAATPSIPIETAGRPQDVAAQARIEGMPLSQAMRAPEPLSPMQTGRPMPASAPDSIAVQADWLASRGGGTARLVLHPPELGEIAIRVTVRNQAVDVVMVAHTALAHQVAEDQSDRLSQAFASRDLRLEQFEVRRGDPSDSSSTGQFGSSDAGERERERAANERELDRGGAVRGGSRRGTSGIEAGIVPPRPASNGRAAGIDLRI